MKVTCAWIKGEIEKEAAAGTAGEYSSSEVVKQVTDTLDTIGK